MRRIIRICGAAVIAVMAVVVLACSSPNDAPPATDVSKAFSAAFMAEQSAPPANEQTYTGGEYTNTISQLGGGSVTFLYSTTGNPATEACTIDGALTFANWVDAFYGYTINGTFDFSMTVGAPGVPRSISMTMTFNLALTGGTISTLTGSITLSTTDAPGAMPVLAGSVTANGHQFDLNELRG